MPADVVVYDLAGLGIEPDWVGEIVHDFPGGEWRCVQRAQGLPFDHGQWRRDLLGRQLHGRYPGQTAPSRPRLY